MVSNQEVLEIRVKKLVSNAKAILTNQIAMPLGARKMSKILHWIDQSLSEKNIDLKIFYDFDKKLDGCPIGSERLLWDRDALKEQDKIIDKVTREFKESLRNGKKTI